MNGIELANLARQQSPDTRVVVISGNPPARALPDGVKFLSKPLYPTAFLQEATY
jgi:two-component system, cell cycle response regulator CpdR